MVQKTLRKSMSSENINDDRYKRIIIITIIITTINRKENIKIFISCHILVIKRNYIKRENKIRNYYEGKLYKYKDYLKNLKSGYKEKKMN